MSIQLTHQTSSVGLSGWEERLYTNRIEGVKKHTSKQLQQNFTGG